jgi:hypothetical protein
MEIAAFLLLATEKCLKGYWKALGNAQRLLESLEKTFGKLLGNAKIKLKPSRKMFPSDVWDEKSRKLSQQPLGDKAELPSPIMWQFYFL